MTVHILTATFVFRFIVINVNIKLLKNIKKYLFCCVVCLYLKESINYLFKKKTIFNKNIVNQI